MPTEEEYAQFFREADKDGDGELDYGELRDMLKRKGYKGSDKQIKKFFKSCDTSGDGKISYEEYMTAMGIQPMQAHKAAIYRRTFQAFDKDGNGVIDKYELVDVYKEMGQPISLKEAENLIREADKDNNGTLSYDEFVAFLFGKDV